MKLILGLLDLRLVFLQSPEDLHPGGDGQTLWVSKDWKSAQNILLSKKYQP